MDSISSLSIGFSIYSAIALLIAFIWFMPVENKRWQVTIFCVLFLGLVSLIQLKHWQFISQQQPLLDDPHYRGLLFFAPPLFYFFSRSLLFRDYRFTLKSFGHWLLPMTFIFLPSGYVIVATLLLGCGYCMWLVIVIYRLREVRNRFRVEFFFANAFALLAIMVMILGSATSIIDPKYFYYCYANGLAFAYFLVLISLLAFPNLINELTEVVNSSYQKSTLARVDLSATIERMQQLLHEEKLFQNDALTLADLADALALSTHQVSELINTQFNMGFSQYLRNIRIAYAKQQLLEQPKASILSVGLEAGFRTQSNFYAAFKASEKLSPGEFRKQQLKQQNGQ
ncbi:MAG: AraC family transcriptional regulator [Gammaproteobacteria bacterium]|nr:AraC family transcriptional regulator [Gammaproteobacteria bacterium]